LAPLVLRVPKVRLASLVCLGLLGRLVATGKTQPWTWTN
jgi:hypothetical protein